MPETHARHLFLPWLRQGLAAAADVRDTPDGPVPGRLTIPVHVAVNQVGTSDVQVRFHGPGDVLGIDPDSIVRTEPRPRSPNFEPNYFPALEFDRPDFPWLFTPARASETGRLRPWLCLVVVPRGDDVSLTVDPRRPLPVLTCPVRELPDLRESWAWAHTQVATEGGPLTREWLQAFLRDSPARAVSRLLCPRRLDPATAYLACLVPTFEAGRKAGLGEAITAADEAELKGAWSTPGPHPDATVRLPVFYHWEFSTGVADDFEALARRLEVRVLPREIGVQRVDMHDPGWGMPPLDADHPGAVMEFTGVLRTPTSHPAPWAADAEAAFRQHLRAVLGMPEGGAAGPVVAPPLYGAEYARASGVPADDEPPHWLRELNLAPRYRIAAGLGVMVVRYEQERLMASAWKQLAAVERTVTEQRRQQFGAAVGDALAAKHLPALGVDPEPDAAASARASGAFAARAMSRERPGPTVVSHARGSLAARLRVRGRLAPEAEAPAGRAAARLRTAAAEPEPPASDAFRFSPSFPRPAVELLRDYFPDLLLPGIAQIPPNTIALLESDPAFVEAFMVGLNHEMGRELLWREFPADRRGTYFQNFWRDTPDSPELPPIAGWAPASHLGEHLRQSGSAPAPDPALEQAIEAAQAQAAALAAAAAEQEAGVAALAVQRDQAAATAAPVRAEYERQRRRAEGVDAQRLELGVAERAATRHDAAAADADQAAAALRVQVAAERAQIAHLEEELQIPAAEAALQAIVAEVAELTHRIDEMPARAAELEAERQAALQAAEALRLRLQALQAEVATLPELETRLAAEERTEAEKRGLAVTEQQAAAAARARAEVQRRRIAELDVVIQGATAYQSRLADLSAQITTLQARIREHQLNQPPAPPKGYPDPGPLPPPEESFSLRTPATLSPETASTDTAAKPGKPDKPGTPKKGTTPPLRGLAVPISDAPQGPLPPAPDEPLELDDYTEYYQWLRQLTLMQNQLMALMNERNQVQASLREIDAARLERTALLATVSAAEQEARAHDQAAADALAAAADAARRASELRGQISHLREQAEGIPALQAEVAAADAAVAAAAARIEELTAHTAELEAARAEARQRATAAEAALQALRAELAERAPEIQARIDALEARVAEQVARATASRTEAAAERTRAAALRSVVAELEALAAQLPELKSSVEAAEAAVAALDGQIDAGRAELAERAAAGAVADLAVVELLNQRTMRQSRLVLLIRGDLLRRYARARIYAVEAEWTDSSRTGRRASATELQPLFHQSWGSDLTLLGFPLTGEQARGGEQHPGWFFVIEEQPTEPRFGLDAPSGSQRPVDQLESWAAVTWDDLVGSPAELADLVHVSIAGRLAGLERPVRPSEGSDDQPPSAAWGRNGAHMAMITRQKPVRMTVHATVWLP